MRKALGAVCLTGLFVLLLSALVVTPSDAVCSPPPPVADLHAAFLPMPPPAAPTVDEAIRPLQPRMLLSALLTLASAALLLLPQCDSNGRVLTAARYENSVYHLFRPEVAGG